MAGEAVVGALRVILGMDTAQYEDGAKRAVKVTDSFGKRMLEVASGIQLQKTLEQAARALVNFGKTALDTADSLFKLSQKTGIPVEQLSGLKHAAELSDVSVESLARGFKNLQIEMNKAASGGIGPAASAFEYLGITLEDIKKGNPQDVFLKIADGVSNLTNETNKVAVSAAIFGNRFGPELIPLLNQGRKGIEDTITAARRLGLIISTETARNAEVFNDRLKDLKSVVSGIALTALEPLAAGLAQVATRLVETVNRTGAVKTAAEGLVRAFVLVTDNLKVLDALLGVFLAKLVIQTVINFAIGMVQLGRAIAAVGVAMALANAASLITVARFAALAAVIALATGQLPTFTEAIEKVGGVIAKILPPDTSSAIAQGLEKLGINLQGITKDLKDLNFTFVDTDNAIDTVLQTMDKLARLRKEALFDPEASKRAQAFAQELAKINLQAREVGGEFTGTLAPGFIAAAQSMKLIKEDGSNLQAILSLSTEQAKQLNAALLGVEGARLTQEFLTPWQLYEEQLKRINLLLDEKKIRDEVGAAASQKAAFDMTAAYGAAAQGIVSPMADAFKSLASINKRYAGAAKAAAIAEATVNTFVAATKALAQGGALGFATAAAVTAAGLANVAKIAATEFATGGSFKVGGGIGGIDSELITFKATPGEMVDIRKPSDARAGVQEITLRGIGGRDLFTGDMLRDLFASLNAGMADGYKLKVAT